MRVTRGPNGVTIASVRKGGGDMAERIGQYPFRLGFRDVLVSGSTQKYAVIYVNDGAVQKDGDEDVEVAAVANNAATGMETGWYDVAEYFNDTTGEQVTNPMTTVLPSEGQKDVYALVYTDDTGSFSVAIQMTPVWPTYSGIATKIARYYLGTITRTDTEVGEETVPVFTISNQALRSGVVETATKDETDGLPKPWELKIEIGATGNPLLCYLPSVYLDGVEAVVDNTRYGATGSGWYHVPYTRDADNWTQINAFIDIEQIPPHVLVAATGPTAPNGYLAGSMMPVGKIATETGASGEELTPEVKAQYVVGDTYRAQDEFRPYKPFELRPIWDETENASIPLVYLPLVYIDGQVATIDNTVYGATGSEWYEIDVPTALSGSASVTAYIKRGTDGNHVKVSTATTAPTGFTDGQIDVGDLVNDNGVWRTVEQYQVGAWYKDYIKPMTLRVIGNDLLVYWPSGSLQSFRISHNSISLDSTHNPNAYGNWYYVARNLNTWTVGDARAIHIDLMSVETNTVYLVPTNLSVGPVVGHVTRLASGFAINQMMTGPQFYGQDDHGGGVGGTIVTVEGASGEASGNFVTWTSGTGPTGAVVFKQHQNIAATKVVLSPSGETDVDTYLKGGADDFGTNVNTENFEDECLKENQEEFVIIGTDDKAARSDHKHWSGDIYATGESGEPVSVFSNAEYWNGFLKKYELLPTAMEEPGPLEEAGTQINSAMVNWEDGTRLQHDGPTGSAGGATGASGETIALLALDNHVHPLNVVTLPTGATGPKASDYVMQDSPTGELGDDPHYARVDHVHPLNVTTLVTGPTATHPWDYVMENGPTAMLGTDPHYARVDHIHPDLHPLRIKIADDVAKTKIIYIPSSAIQITGSYGGSAYITNNCTQHEGDWYRIDTTAVPGDVYLNGYVYWYSNPSETNLYFTFIVSGSRAKFPVKPSNAITRQFRWKIGNITNNVCTNFIREAIAVPGFIEEQGPTGASGESAGFGNPTATATIVAAGGNPTANVTASGTDKSKIFSFEFGIPAGPTGAPGTPGAAGTQVVIEDGSGEASGVLTCKMSGPTGVVLETHTKLIGSSVNPSGTVGGSISYKGTGYSTLSGLIGAMIPTEQNKQWLVSSQNVKDGFNTDTDKVLSTADIESGTAGTVTGDVMTYDVTNKTIYTNQAVPGSKVSIPATVGQSQTNVLLDTYFNASGLFKYTSVGLGTDDQPQTSVKAIGFDGTPQNPAQSASLIDVPTLAPTGEQSLTPIADGPTGEIGTSTYAARADHKHPIEMGVGTLIRKETAETDDGETVTGFSFDTEEWSPGANGIKIPICVRCYSENDEFQRCMVFRDFTISKNGTIAHIGPEYAMYITQYYGT